MYHLRHMPRTSKSEYRYQHQTLSYLSFFKKTFWVSELRFVSLMPYIDLTQTFRMTPHFTTSFIVLTLTSPVLRLAFSVLAQYMPVP